MLLAPCEVAVKTTLPCIRAMLANELMNEHHLTQAIVAKLLGVSQPAVSLYRKQLRGNSLKLQDDVAVRSLVKKYSSHLAKNELSHRQKMDALCQICKIILAKGYLCNIHESLDPTVDAETCNVCRSNDLICPRFTRPLIP